MQKHLQKLGITDLNSMQLAAIESIKDNSNTLLLAPTGSGKTLAFLLPLLDILDKNVSGIQVLILSPTRELALQITSVWKNLGTGFGITTFYGGHSVEIETNELKTPPAILVGTPGRVADHFTRRTLDSSSIRTLIFDEFDKSLEMGFQDVIQYILGNLRAINKQVFVSATQGVRLPDFEELNTVDFLQSHLNEQKLKLKFVRLGDKIECLAKLLNQISQESTIVFCNQRDEVEMVAYLLQNKGINCAVFHGKIEQQDREKALIRFRNGSIRYLICTDLAARGLDIPQVAHVIHFSLPHHEQEFVHRNGRTARMNAHGTAYCFLKDKLPLYLTNFPEELVLLEEKVPEILPEEWVTLYVSGGKKDKISKMDIVGFFLKIGQLPKEALGKIEVQDSASYVAVSKDHVSSLLKNIKDQKMKGKRMKIEMAS